ncbi:MAG TPA: GAF and ANTAR domain-containing protein [Jatrophihabitantaceae bacterium]|jgi:GAF domain-containing protein|nr:GAF and ANTAR domain-containing protein [Jatrophihabitantaceae bacterium]
MVESDTRSAASAVLMVAQLAAELADAPSLEELLERALGLAIDIVPGCEQAGISLLQDRVVETPASVGDLAERCDKLQEQLGDGPCVTALLEADIIRIDDVLSDNRWPEFSAGAAKAGLRSMLACRLATQRDKLGALNMYSTEPDAFTAESEAMAIGYAAHVSLALSALDREANLRRAMKSRELIGQAMGILMERHRVTASQAFDVMVHASQRTNVKLRSIAEELVRTGSLPSN